MSFIEQLSPTRSEKRGVLPMCPVWVYPEGMESERCSGKIACITSAILDLREIYVKGNSLQYLM